MKGILDHADRAIEEWWTPISQPHLTPEVKARLITASEELADGKPVAEWVAWRDEQLVELMKLQAASELRKPKRSDDGSTAERVERAINDTCALVEVPQARSARRIGARETPDSARQRDVRGSSGGRTERRLFTACSQSDTRVR